MTTTLRHPPPQHKQLKKEFRLSRRMTAATPPLPIIEPTRIAVLGAKKAGSTTWTKFFTNLNETKPPQPYSAMDEAVPKRWKIDEQEHNLEISDTGDLSSFPALFCHFIISNNGFVVIYSITDKQSLEWAQKTIHQIKEIRHRAKFSGCPIILVGNKADTSSERVISTEEG
eukprot:TRINITY_DN495_c0_g1_i3.p1 TRINITY_DN495_c0_g1~~TRINITY_DN495_c0_g1_i3.p1  ORF type:complete len:171 (+),score=29.52 TRINITY_DN495_c0_g1_i3:234-746(+)